MVILYVALTATNLYYLLVEQSPAAAIGTVAGALCIYFRVDRP